jgi:hypothetical protein
VPSQLTQNELSILAGLGGGAVPYGEATHYRGAPLRRVRIVGGHADLPHRDLVIQFAEDFARLLGAALEGNQRLAEAFAHQLLNLPLASFGVRARPVLSSVECSDEELPSPIVHDQPLQLGHAALLSSRAISSRAPAWVCTDPQ